MTQADSARALRMSLDSPPIEAQGQATDVDPGRSSWAFCVLCGKTTHEPVLVGFREGGSLAGENYYADPPCARSYANTSSAPEWLRERFPVAS